MYSNDDIERFLQKITEKASSNASDDSTAVPIDKKILKDLILSKVDYRAKVIRLVAELCKRESEREECLQIDLISPLKDPLQSGSTQEKLESCRAIGNMCYENANGCELVYDQIGLDSLFGICRYACQTNEQEATQLRMIILGALHNIVNSNEKIAELIVKESIFEIFRLYMPYLSESKIIPFLFSICSNLIDYDNKCEYLVSSHLLSEIGNTITESDIYENRTVVLSYLLEACEEDSIKEEICSSLLYYKLINLAEKYAGIDEEFLREDCYILVVLVTTDKPIEYLINSKERDLLQHGIAWLEKESLQLKMTGALIINNLTRNDQSARSILTDQRQPDKKLIEQLNILTEQLSSLTDEQAKVAHGILGALRNLAVPIINRSLLVEHDILDQVIPYIFAKNFDGEIAYKATGVIRFLLREAKESSKQLLINDDNLSQIVQNSQSIHRGLQFESRRVLFLIPVATKAIQSIESLARNGALPLITSTLASCDVPTNRGIIQNEALIALNIIMMLANEMICEKLEEANFHENFKEFFKQDIQQAEIVNNLLQLIHLIRKQKNFLTNEQLKEYQPLLINMRNSQNCNGKLLIDRTLEILQNELE